MKKTITIIILIITGTLSYGQNNCWSKIAASGAGIIALANDGTLWSWGSGSNGNSGLGDQNNRSVPTQIGTDNDWQTISSNSAIKTNGTLWVWGTNNYAQLGVGDLNNRLVPTQVGTDTNWASAAVGYSAHSLAIKTDGTLWSWGYGGSGQLGNGNSSSVFPVQVGTGTTWSSVTVGSNFSMATKTDNTLWVWGLNSSRELGLFNNGTDQEYPTLRTGSWLISSAGAYHGLGIRVDGTLYAWGDNGMGRLGLGTNTQVNNSTKVGTDTDWLKVTAGLYQTLAIKSNGTLWSWGYNNYGQLGQGTIGGNYYSPTQVGTDTDWQDVALGSYFGVAIKASGEIYTWGRNEYGQLGHGNNTNSSSPGLVNCPTALKLESFSASNFKMFPNPVKDNLTISLDSEISGVSIYNLLGQEVLTKSINATQDRIDVSKLSSGSYIIKVLTQEGITVNKKITKQ
jgi:alpha-tubulin suppressor-like RCC1 family protein